MTEVQDQESAPERITIPARWSLSLSMPPARQPAASSWRCVTRRVCGPPHARAVAASGSQRGACARTASCRPATSGSRWAPKDASRRSPSPTRLSPATRSHRTSLQYVTPDGADTAMCNFVRGIDLTDPAAAAALLKPGTRMKAVFENERHARVTDFHWVIA